MQMTDMIATGVIPLNPGVLDYADSDGKIILWVKDEEEGRSVYMSISMYGEMVRTYEVAYADFENVVTKMMGDVIMANMNDPFAELLGGTDG